MENVTDYASDGIHVTLNLTIITPKTTYVTCNTTYVTQETSVVLPSVTLNKE